MTKVFVFGSNLAGRHGAGAAKRALTGYGARYGQGKGLQGNSYAIPTKDGSLKTLSLARVSKYVEEFKEFAFENPDREFYVTPIGTGLAGFSHEDIAPLVVDSPKNCIFTQAWKKFLGNNIRYFNGNL
jgi:hypothetical protein